MGEAVVNIWREDNTKINRVTGFHQGLRIHSLSSVFSYYQETTASLKKFTEHKALNIFMVRKLYLHKYDKTNKQYIIYIFYFHIK